MNKKLIEEVVVKDLEDGSKITVAVYSVDEMGNASKPGVQFLYMGYFVNYEPVSAEKLEYQAKKAGGGPLYLESSSWAVHADQFVKCYYVPGNGGKPKARVEVKTRSEAKPVVREYELPFSF